jgi:23S rRNA G2445 N2-methylase RlmL
MQQMGDEIPPKRPISLGVHFDRQMKIAMRLLDAVHFRCLNARGTLFTVQKALPLSNVFVDITNRFVCIGVDGSGSGLGARVHLGGPRQC